MHNSYSTKWIRYNKNDLLIVDVIVLTITHIKSENNIEVRCNSKPILHLAVLSASKIAKPLFSVSAHIAK
jgi:hypothetical protein